MREYHPRRDDASAILLGRMRQGELTERAVRTMARLGDPASIGLFPHSQPVGVHFSLTDVMLLLSRDTCPGLPAREAVWRCLRLVISDLVTVMGCPDLVEDVQNGGWSTGAAFFCDEMYLPGSFVFSEFATAAIRWWGMGTMASCFLSSVRAYLPLVKWRMIDLIGAKGDAQQAFKPLSSQKQGEINQLRIKDLLNSLPAGANVQDGRGARVKAQLVALGAFGSDTSLSK